MKYVEILKQNKELRELLKDQKEYKISILSNITISQMSPILEYELRSLHNIYATLDIGNYNNIIQDSILKNDKDCIIIFWELANFSENFSSLANLFNEKELNEFINKTILEIELLFQNLKKCPLVIFNKFSSLIFNKDNLKTNNLDIICNKLNEYLENKKPLNFQITDIEKTIAKISLENSINLRDFYSSKSLYTIEFFKTYVQHIKPIIYSILGHSKKAIIFDCDNTLWNGILGEDGIEIISSNFENNTNSCFIDVQQIVKCLYNNGVIIGLCSKNNFNDVEEFFNKNKMPLSFNDFIIKKINWNDKVTNLKEIALELNINLDSLIFVDDSAFEIELVNKMLPEVTTLLVPKEKSLYAEKLNKITTSFFKLNETKEDILRASSYIAQEKRELLKSEFKNIDDYLKSLKINIKIYKDNPTISSRISQLTQKTNQFNLTTKRYSETEILSLIDNPNWLTYAFNTSDQLGDSGITGIALVRIEDDIANIDSFLLSCRIIGRNVEYAFFNWLINDLKSRSIKRVNASYIQTIKNSQVKEFYDNLGFQMKEQISNNKEYTILIKEYTPKDINYIKVIHEG